MSETTKERECGRLDTGGSEQCAAFSSTSSRALASTTILCESISQQGSDSAVMSLRSSSDPAMIGHVREIGTWTGEGIFDNDISVNVVTRHPSSVTLAAAVRKKKKGKTRPWRRPQRRPSRTPPVRSLTPGTWPLVENTEREKKEASARACREGSRG
jgi:hypothetical protein